MSGRGKEYASLGVPSASSSVDSGTVWGRHRVYAQIACGTADPTAVTKTRSAVGSNPQLLLLTLPDVPGLLADGFPVRMWARRSSRVVPLNRAFTHKLRTSASPS